MTVHRFPIRPAPPVARSTDDLLTASVRAFRERAEARVAAVTEQQEALWRKAASRPHPRVWAYPDRDYSDD